MNVKAICPGPFWARPAPRPIAIEDEAMGHDQWLISPSGLRNVMLERSCGSVCRNELCAPKRMRLPGGADNVSPLPGKPSAEKVAEAA